MDWLVVGGVASVVAAAAAVAALAVNVHHGRRAQRQHAEVLMRLSQAVVTIEPRSMGDDGGRLKVRYRVVNTGPSPVVLLRVGVRTIGSRSMEAVQDNIKRTLRPDSSPYDASFLTEIQAKGVIDFVVWCDLSDGQHIESDRRSTKFHG